MSEPGWTYESDPVDPTPEAGALTPPSAPVGGLATDVETTGMTVSTANGQPEIPPEPAHGDESTGMPESADDDAPITATRLRWRLKREARYGIAALLSFLVLATVLLFNKGGGKSPGTKSPPVARIPPSSVTSPPDKLASATLAPEKESPAARGQAPAASEEAVASRDEQAVPVPAHDPAVTTHLPEPVQLASNDPAPGSVSPMETLPDPRAEPPAPAAPIEPPVTEPDLPPLGGGEGTPATPPEPASPLAPGTSPPAPSVPEGESLPAPVEAPGVEIPMPSEAVPVPTPAEPPRSVEAPNSSAPVELPAPAPAPGGAEAAPATIPAPNEAKPEEVPVPAEPPASAPNEAKPEEVPEPAPSPASAPNEAKPEEVPEPAPSSGMVPPSGETPAEPTSPSLPEAAPSVPEPAVAVPPPSPMPPISEPPTPTPTPIVPDGPKESGTTSGEAVPRLIPLPTGRDAAAATSEGAAPGVSLPPFATIPGGPVPEPSTEPEPPSVAEPPPMSKEEPPSGEWVALPSAGDRLSRPVERPRAFEPPVKPTERPIEQVVSGRPLPVGSLEAEPAAPTTEERLSPSPASEPSTVHDAVEWVPHLVQRGESFWTISQLYYGSARFYKALHAANLPKVGPLTQPLYVGQTVRIPPPEELDSALFEPLRSRSNTASRESGINSENASTSRPRPSVRPASSRPDDLGEESNDRLSGELEVALPRRDPFARRETVEGAEGGIEPPSRGSSRPRRPVYKVRAFETLRSIARDTLGGDSRRADEIWRLNAEVIDDPNRLPEGLIIELPDDAKVGLGAVGRRAFNR